jgi:response regulator RpfG family c-di-GMP phosphodiesterase
MASHGTILLVSGSPGLNEVLGTLVPTYSLSLITADSAKAGLALYRQAGPDCVIFDARLLRDRHRIERVKDKFAARDIPVFFLNIGADGRSRSSGVHSSFSLEPIIKFVAAQSARLKMARPTGFWNRFAPRPRAKALQQ